jgi:hypothetical protein
MVKRVPAFGASDGRSGVGVEDGAMTAALSAPPASPTRSNGGFSTGGVCSCCEAEVVPPDPGIAAAGAPVFVVAGTIPMEAVGGPTVAAFAIALVTAITGGGASADSVVYGFAALSRGSGRIKPFATKPGVVAGGVGTALSSAAPSEPAFRDCSGLVSAAGGEDAAAAGGLSNGPALTDGGGFDTEPVFAGGTTVGITATVRSGTAAGPTADRVPGGSVNNNARPEDVLAGAVTPRDHDPRIALTTRALVSGSTDPRPPSPSMTMATPAAARPARLRSGVTPGILTGG